MEINFADILIEHKRLILPSLGKFTLVPMPATLDTKEGLIFSPYYKIQFEQLERYPSYSREIADYLYLRMGIEKERAIEQAKQILAELKIKQEESAIVPLQGLGRIFTTKTGKINFMPEDLDLLSRENPLRPAYALVKSTEKPILDNKWQADNTPAPAPTPIVQTQETESKKKPWWLFFLFLALPLLYFLFSKDDTTSGSRYSVSKKGSIDNRMNIKPLEEDLILEENSTLNHQAEKPFAHPSPPSTSINPTSQTQQKCTIIVGAFRDQGNIQKIKNQLKTYPGEILTIPMGDLTRVGISFSCDPTILNPYWDQIREEIQPKAWLLEN
jgi:hypothetical protein